MTQNEFRNWLYLMGFTNEPLTLVGNTPPPNCTVMKNPKISVFIYWYSKTTRAYLDRTRILDTAKTPQELEKLRNVIERHL